MDKVLFSSVTHTWGTPQKLFNELNAEFGFDVDAAASDFNHKLPVYWTEADNSLNIDWGTRKVFVNPPYGRALYDWVKKSYEAARGGATVVMLIPSRTDTKYFHEYAVKGEIRFIKGRLKFENENREATSPAPFPSMIVIFRP